MQEWEYEKAADLELTFVERLRSFPREPDLLVYGMRAALSLVVRTWLRLYYRFEVFGNEQFPSDGSFVLVANHSSHLDALCLVSVLPIKKVHRTFPVAAADYFFQSVPRTILSAIVVNALPFQRQTNIRQSLALCKELLANQGNILIIFPEGTRSKTGEISTFKPGVGLLLAGTNVPVLPCHLSGTYESWPKGSRVPKPGRLRLRIGAPRSYSHLQPGKASALKISEELRENVIKLAEM